MEGVPVEASSLAISSSSLYDVLGGVPMLLMSHEHTGHMKGHVEASALPHKWHKPTQYQVPGAHSGQCQPVQFLCLLPATNSSQNQLSQCMHALAFSVFGISCVKRLQWMVRNKKMMSKRFYFFLPSWTAFSNCFLLLHKTIIPKTDWMYLKTLSERIPHTCFFLGFGCGWCLSGCFWFGLLFLPSF